MPMSLRQALKRADKLGMKVTNQRKSGEVRVQHGRVILRLNMRKKDAPRVLTVLIKRASSR